MWTGTVPAILGICTGTVHALGCSLSRQGAVPPTKPTRQTQSNQSNQTNHTITNRRSGAGTDIGCGEIKNDGDEEEDADV